MSPLTTSYAETNEQLSSIVGGSLSLGAIKSNVLKLWKRCVFRKFKNVRLFNVMIIFLELERDVVRDALPVAQPPTMMEDLGMMESTQ